MNKKLVLAAALFMPLSVFSAESTTDTASADNGFSTTDERVRATLKKYLPTFSPDAIADSSVPGLYEIVYGAQVAYVAGDGQYLIQGKVVNLENGQDVAEETKKNLRLEALKTIDKKDLIVYGSDDARHKITVFTDIDCGYCRKLHNEMPQYNSSDIQVSYLFYPRSGLGGDSYKKAVSVWCADDKNAAMDKAKAGVALEVKDCINPVAKEYELGQALGINGTPAIIFENGELYPGYAPAKRLKKVLDAKFKL